MNYPRGYEETLARAADPKDGVLNFLGRTAKAAVIPFRRAN